MMATAHADWQCPVLDAHGPQRFVAGPNTKTCLDFVLSRLQQVDDMQSKHTRMSTEIANVSRSITHNENVRG